MGNMDSGAVSEAERPETPAAAPVTGGDPTVRLERVSKHFGDLVAVRDLDLDIGRGEFFTLLGPSRCGKTTTLRNGDVLQQPTPGPAPSGGEEVARLHG